MDVQVGQLGPDRLDQLDVPLAGEAGMDAALQAHLGAAAVPRLVAAAQDLLAPEQVGGAAQVLGQLALREGAEAALEVADVGVVDVPADDVGDLVAVALGAHLIGRARQQVDLGAARLEQRSCLRLRVVRRLQRLGEGGRDAADAGPRPRRRRAAGRADEPLLGRPRVAEPVGGRVHVRDDGRIEPGVGIAQVARVDGEAGQQRQAGGGGGLAEPVDVGPGGLGIDVVGRHRRDAAPVVDAGLEQAREAVVGEVRRGLQRHVVGQDQPRDGDRPPVVVERRLGRGGHLRVGLGAEVLDDHLLQVTVLQVQVA